MCISEGKCVYKGVYRSIFSYKRVHVCTRPRPVLGVLYRGGGSKSSQGCNGVMDRRWDGDREHIVPDVTRVELDP